MFPIPSGGVIYVARAHARGTAAASAGTSVPCPVSGRRTPAAAGRAEASGLELLAEHEPAILELGGLRLERRERCLQPLQLAVVALIGDKVGCKSWHLTNDSRDPGGPKMP